VPTAGAIPNTDLVSEDYLPLGLGLASVLLRKRLLIDVSAFHTANDNHLLPQRKLNAMEGVRYTPDWLGHSSMVTTQRYVH
jgi:hypothetical protein